MTKRLSLKELDLRKRKADAGPTARRNKFEPTAPAWDGEAIDSEGIVNTEDIGVHGIKTLLRVARVAAPILGEDALVIFERLLPDTEQRKPPTRAAVVQMRRAGEAA